MVRMRKHVDGLHGFDGVLAVEQRQIARLSSRIATHIYYGAGSGVENHVDYILVHAIRDARINSEANGIHNTEFFAGDMKDVLTDEFIAEHGRPEVMIVDPPRAGMHEDVVNVILNAEIGRAHV